MLAAFPGRHLNAPPISTLDPARYSPLRRFFRRASTYRELSGRAGGGPFVREWIGEASFSTGRADLIEGPEIWPVAPGRRTGVWAGVNDSSA